MSYPALQLADLDLGRLRLVKEVVLAVDGYDHSRWIFRGRPGAAEHLDNSYVKLWNPSHLRRDNLLRGVAAGFYDEQTVPALQALVWHKGVCRGYVMASCRPARQLDPAFFHLIRERTVQTGYFHPQFSREHVRRFGRGYSLIDLEGVYALRELPQLAAHRCVFDHAGYERFVRELYAGGEPGAAASSATEPARSGLQRAAAALRHKPLAWGRRLWREAAIAWGARFNHVHLIER